MDDKGNIRGGSWCCRPDKYTTDPLSDPPYCDEGQNPYPHYDKNCEFQCTNKRYTVIDPNTEKPMAGKWSSWIPKTTHGSWTEVGHCRCENGVCDFSLPEACDSRKHSNFNPSTCTESHGPGWCLKKDKCWYKCEDNGSWNKKTSTCK